MTLSLKCCQYLRDVMFNIAELHRAETTPIPSATDSLQNDYGYERTFTLTTEGFNMTENATFDYDYYIYQYDDLYLSFNDEAKANGTG